MKEMETSGYGQGIHGVVSGDMWRYCGSKTQAYDVLFPR
jgi:hypothetical protein